MSQFLSFKPALDIEYSAQCSIPPALLGSDGSQFLQAKMRNEEGPS